MNGEINEALPELESFILNYEAVDGCENYLRNHEAMGDGVFKIENNLGGPGS